jgi:hypothetical protein
VLNAITTLAMVQLGKVYENLMVDLKRYQQQTPRPRCPHRRHHHRFASIEEAFEWVDKAGGHVKVAIVMQKRNVTLEEARALLAKSGGKLRAALSKDSSYGNTSNHSSLSQSFRPLDIGRCFNESLAVFTRNVLILILAAIIFEALSFFSLFILCRPALRRHLSHVHQQPSASRKKIDIGLMFRMFRRFWPLVGLFFLTLLPIAVGLVLLHRPRRPAHGPVDVSSFPLMIERNLHR